MGNMSKSMQLLSDEPQVDDELAKAGTSAEDKQAAFEAMVARRQGGDPILDDPEATTRSDTEASKAKGCCVLS